ncbi:MAG: hypothetical protein KUG77_16750, partial [Nannocystaceae bacterium]|nr:hypothetical protein [Nannocystaceae bacterium]
MRFELGSLTRRATALALTGLLSLVPGCGDDTGGAGGSTGGSTSSATPTTSGTTVAGSTGGSSTSVADDSSTGLGPEAAAEEWPLLGCDPLVPSYCSAPFPSNVYTVEDKGTGTGRRVMLAPELLPADTAGATPDPTPWNGLDGFSPGIAISAHFPDVTQDTLLAGNVASATSIPRSLEDDSPTVLLDVTTGERIPHWVDLDATGADDAQRLFMIRPAIRLNDASRYIVAIRGLQDGQGSPITATEGFAALRDRTDSDDAAINDRRPLYGDIFMHTTTAGLDRDSMQLAWDFTTSSRENNTGWMVHMRDEAFELIGEDGPTYTITSVDDEWDKEGLIAHRVFLDMEVPMYLDQVAPLSTLQFGDDGMPEPTGTALFEVEILIPTSAATTPVRPLQYGHGLLGSKSQIESGHFREFINDYGYALFGVTFIGFSQDDELFIGAMLGNGSFDQFKQVIDRQQQGMLNSLVAMRLMLTTFAQDETYGSLIDNSAGHYLGISQGGIYGPTYMALSTDVQRGTFGVPGMPYNVLLSRSVDFDLFFDIMRASYPDARDHMMLLNYAQMLWDRIAPTGYTPYLLGDTFPGTDPKEVLLRAAVGDHQVTNFGAHIMSRSLGIPHLDTGIREVWGLDSEAGPIAGSAGSPNSYSTYADPAIGPASESKPQTSRIP